MEKTVPLTCTCSLRCHRILLLEKTVPLICTCSLCCYRILLWHWTVPLTCNVHVQDVRLEECKSKSYPALLPSTSIVIVFHNEAWTTLLRNDKTITTLDLLFKEMKSVSNASHESIDRQQQNIKWKFFIWVSKYGTLFNRRLALRSLHSIINRSPHGLGTVSTALLTDHSL